MKKHATAFDTLRALAPEPAPTDLDAARRRLDEMLAQEPARIGGPRELSAVTPRRARPTGGRARRIALVAVAAAAVLCVGTGVLRWEGGSRGEPLADFLGVMPAAAAGTSACGLHPDDSLHDLPRSEWPDHPGATAVMVGLPRADTLGQPHLGAWVPACTAAPTALLVDATGTQGIAVYQDVADPFAGDDGLEPQALRGTTGSYLGLASGVSYLTWTDADGVRWLAQANGVDRDRLVATVDDLQTGATDEPQAPNGFVRVPAASPASGAEGFTWTVQYGSPSTPRVSADGGVIEALPTDYAFVEARRPAMTPAALSVATTPGARLVRFDAVDAVFIPDTGAGASLRWVQGGTSFRLGMAGASLDQLEAAARTITTSPDAQRRPGR